MKIENYSELELCVMVHMIEEGLDPQNKDDIEEFWRQRLETND